MALPVLLITLNMQGTRQHRQQGWTLLELLLVLVCVSALTAVLIYSFMGSISKQQSVLRVSTTISRLIDAAHTWRHQSTSYAAINLKAMKAQGILPDNWPSDYITQQDGFSVKPFDASTKCKNHNCFVIQFNTHKHDPCLYADNLAKSNPMLTVPSIALCKARTKKKPTPLQPIVQVVYD